MQATEFHKTGGESMQYRPVYAGAAWMVGLSIFLERFVYYGGRSILFMFIFQGLGMGSMSGLPRLLYPMLLFASLVMGMMVDSLLEKRLSVAVGATMNGIGFLLVATGERWPILLGMALVVVGSGAARIGNITYFGYLLSHRRGKIEGGYALVYVAWGLAAMLGSILVPLSSVVWGYATSFAFLGLLGLLQAGFVVLMAATGIWPSTWTLAGEPQPSVAMRIGGGLVMLLLAMVLAAAFAVLENASLASIGPAILQVMVMVGGIAAFVVYAVARGEDSGRRNAIMVLMVLTSTSVWAALSISSSLPYQFGMADQIGNSIYLETIVVSMVCIGIGLVLLLGGGAGRQGFGGSSVRVLVGLVIASTGALVHVLLPSLGLPVVWIGAVLLALGEGLYNFTLFATAWAISPMNRTGTSFALLSFAAGMGGLLSDFFEGSSGEGGEAFGFSLPMVGIILFSTLTVLMAIALWAVLRNHVRPHSGPGHNPFDL